MRTNLKEKKSCLENGFIQIKMIYIIKIPSRLCRWRSPEFSEPSSLIEIQGAMVKSKVLWK